MEPLNTGGTPVGVKQNIYRKDFLLNLGSRTLPACDSDRALDAIEEFKSRKFLSSQSDHLQLGCLFRWCWLMWHEIFLNLIITYTG